MSENITTFYKIPAPYSAGDTFIEVWGDGEMGWYEWRAFDRERVLKESDAKQYGNAEIALRDALIAMSED